MEVITNCVMFLLFAVPLKEDPVLFYARVVWVLEFLETFINCNGSYLMFFIDFDKKAFEYCSLYRIELP